MNYPTQPPPPYGRPPGPPGPYPPPWWQQQHPGPYGQPPGPPTRRTGVIVAVVAVIVLVGALAITGFVAPGFFLPDDKPAAGEGSIAPEQLEQAAADPQDLADAIVAGLKAKDKVAVEGLQCADATEDAKGIASVVSMVQDARLEAAVTKKSDTEASARIAMTANGTSASFTADLTGSGGKWCWQGLVIDAADMPEPSPEDQAAQRDAREVAQQFVGSIKKGSRAGATKVMCEKPGTAETRMIDAVIDAGFDMRIDEVMAGGRLTAVLITGEIGGKAAKGTVMTSTDPAGGKRCVDGFLFN